MVTEEVAFVNKGSSYKFRLESDSGPESKAVLTLKVRHDSKPCAR